MVMKPERVRSSGAGEAHVTLGLLKAYRVVFSFLVRRHRKQLLVLGLAMPIIAVMETAVLGLIALYVSVVSAPEQFLETGFAARLIAVIPGVSHDPRNIILWLSGAVVTGVFAKNVCVSFYHYAVTKVSESISAFFGARFLEGAIAMPYQWHISQNASDLATALYWREAIGSGLIRNALQVLADLAVIFCLALTLVVLRPIVSVVVLGVCACGAVAIFTRIGPALERKSIAYAQHMGAINKGALQIINGIKEIKLFGAGLRLRTTMTRMVDLSTIQARKVLLVRIPRDLLEFLGIAVLAGTTVGLTIFSDTAASGVTGTLALLAVTAWRVLPAISRLLGGVSEARLQLAPVSRVIGYLELFRRTRERAPCTATSVPIQAFTRGIRVEDVSLTYEGSSTPALHGIFLAIARGESVGLVGPSGAGKSTLSDVISGILSPSTGRILVDDVLLDDGNRASWMRHIGYVSQSPFLCDDTLAANVALGVPPDAIDRQRVVKCLDQAHLGEMLAGLKAHLDTQLGERGSRLSGGQLQRVAIARALYKEPQIIILDEATSALDSRSEEAIRETLRELHGTMTILIIAHRLSTVSGCDRLVWIDKGCLRMVGDAQDVIRRYTGLG